MRNTPKYNRKKVQGSERKIIMQLGGGLNEVLPSTHIDDGQIARGRNFYSPDGMTLRSIPADQWDAPLSFDNAGVGYRAATFNGWYSDVPILTARFVGSPTLAYEAYNIQKGALSSALSVASLHWKVGVDYESPMKGVLYVTQAVKYAVYWSSYENTLLVVNLDTPGVVEQTLPNNIIPQKVISHRTRLFVLDHNNTIWWCKAGDLTTWYGEPPTEEYVSAEAGYWFIDSDLPLHNMESLGEDIFIFGESKIYRFTGYSDDTFVMSPFASGIGASSNNKNGIITGDGRLYFVQDFKVYEMDNTTFPRVISEPLIAGDSVMNGIVGGIDAKQWSDSWYFDSLAYGKNKLYFYPSTSLIEIQVGASYYKFQIPCYIFDTRRRIWHMQDALYYIFTKTANHNYNLNCIIAGDEYGDVIAVASMEDNYSSIYNYVTIASNIGAFRYHAGDGSEPYQSNYAYENEYYSWFLSKAFSTVLDGKYKLYEVDIQWRYVGEDDDKRFIGSLGWYDNGLIYPNSGDLESDYLGGTEVGIGDQMVYKPYEWDGEVRSYKTYIDNQDLAAIDEDDTAWQKKVHVARFRYEPYGTNQITPYAQLYFLVQYEAIQIDRVELKYRAIGASR